jgi:hypothetical protein
LLAEEEVRIERKLDFYFQYAQKIDLKVDLDELARPLTDKDVKKLQDKVDGELGPSHPARCTSAIYRDEKGRPILFYFGKRKVRSKTREPVR